jgi:hypothetical protein
MKNKFLKLTTLPLVSTIVLTPIIASSITSCSKNSDSHDEDNAEYVGNSDGTNWKGRKTGTLSLSFSKKRKTADIVSSSNNFKAKNLIIPDYVEYEGEKYATNKIVSNAFQSTASSSKLTGTLTLSNSIKEIGQYAFSFCAITGELIIPDNVEIIQQDAFSYISISSLVLNAPTNNFDSELVLNYHSFYDTPNLTSIKFYDNIWSNTVGNNVFKLYNVFNSIYCIE